MIFQNKCCIKKNCILRRGESQTHTYGPEKNILVFKRCIRKHVGTFSMFSRMSCGIDVRGAEMFSSQEPGECVCGCENVPMSNTYVYVHIRRAPPMRSHPHWCTSHVSRNQLSVKIIACMLWRALRACAFDDKRPDSRSHTHTECLLCARVCLELSPKIRQQHLHTRWVLHPTKPPPATAISGSAPLPFMHIYRSFRVCGCVSCDALRVHIKDQRGRQ